MMTVAIYLPALTKFPAGVLTKQNMQNILEGDFENAQEKKTDCCRLSHSYVRPVCITGVCIHNIHVHRCNIGLAWRLCAASQGFKSNFREQRGSRFGLSELRFTGWRVNLRSTKQVGSATDEFCVGSC
jgi:hypothetical protein